MAGFGMLEIVINAFFLTQARDEMQIGFTILHAVFTRLIDGKTLEGKGFGGEILFPQYQGNNINDGFMLENAMVATRAEKPEPRHKGAAIMSAEIAGMNLFHLLYEAP